MDNVACIVEKQLTDIYLSGLIFRLTILIYTYLPFNRKSFVFVKFMRYFAPDLNWET